MDWMHNKDKKNILNFTLLIAISLSTVSFFSPVTCFNSSDVLDDKGYEEYDWYWTLESSFLLNKLSIYDFKNTIDENGNVYYRYSIIDITIYESGQKGDWIELSDYTIDEPNLLSRSLGSMIILIIYFILGALFFYFSYKTLKQYYKENNYIFYMGLISLTIFLAFIIVSCTNINFYDTQKLGYINYISFGYGFYLAMTSIILFFVLYFIRPYFLDFKKE